MLRIVKLRATALNLWILAKFLSWGLAEPFKFIDKNYPNNLINHPKKEEVLNQKQIIQAHLRNAHEIVSSPRYLELNKIGLNINKHIRIAILVNSPENELISDVLSELYDSAINIGQECKFFMMSGKAEESNLRVKNKFEIENLLEIERYKPDLVFAEAHAKISKNYNSQIIFLEELKKRIKFKFFLISIDLWRDYDINCINNWKQIHDLLVHLDKQSARDFQISKEFWWPYFGHPKSNSQMVEPLEQKFDVTFSGNLQFPERRFWLYSCSNIARTYKIRFKVNAITHSFGKLKSRSIYLNELLMAKTCLNHTWKKTGFTLITFRTLDIVNSGRTLLQQEDEMSKPLGDFLIPYKHYIPFTSLSELAAIFEIIKEDPKLIINVGKVGKVFYEENYTSYYLWQILIYKLKSLNYDA